MLTSRTWVFALRESEGCWTFGLRPINYRSSGTAAFHYVQTGDIVAVQKLLAAGELSIWDVSCFDDDVIDTRGGYTLLMVCSH